MVNKKEKIKIASFVLKESDIKKLEEIRKQTKQNKSEILRSLIRNEFKEMSLN